ncbi:MAG: polyketide synthase dehydratase domain-containing protein, partial [Polyangiaceae bacterium]|nr:polyketide synthase dehydratase domain-containing protein [Polyangiaceae bacterium]
ALPAKPFDPRHHAIESGPVAEISPVRARGEHPLLGAPLSLSAHPTQRYWESLIDLNELRFLADHRIGEVVVLPAAAIMEMALAAGRGALGDVPLMIEDARFTRAVTLAGDAPLELQLALGEEGPGRYGFRLSSRRAASGDSWTLHATGRIRIAIETEPAAPLDLRAVRERCRDIEQGPTFYDRARAVGLGYGPAFQGIARVHLGDAEALAELTLPSPAGSARPFIVHPALLDAGVQAAAAVSLCRGSTTLGMPVGIRSLRVHKPGATPSLSHASLREEAGGRFDADVRLLDDQGEIIIEING